MSYNELHMNEQIRKMLSEHGIQETASTEQLIEALMEDLSTYHREVEYQNEELRETQLTLELTNGYYHDLFADAPIGYIVYDEAGHITEVNTFCITFLQSTRHDLLNQLITDLIHPDSQDTFYLHNREIRQQGKANSCVISLLGVDKASYEVKFQSNMVTRGDNVFIRSAFIDVTQERIQARRIAFLTFTDQLTGLKNRTYFESEVVPSIGASTYPIGVLMCDANGLKITNDAFGHETGDALLRAASEVLQATCPDKSEVIRFGGDEFVVVIPRTHQQEMIHVIHEITKATQEKTINHVPLSLSIGYAIQPDTSSTLKVVLRQAENHMYQNKLLDSEQYHHVLINSIAQALFRTYPQHAAHAQLVQQISREIGIQMQLDQASLYALQLAANLHDIGMISLSIPPDICERDLPPDQRLYYRLHPERGYRILSSWLHHREVAEAVLSHHEAYDGSGYPLGLREEEIPLLARILALADHAAKYTNSHEDDGKDVLKQVQNLAGKQLDPHLVDYYLQFVGKRT